MSGFMWYPTKTQWVIIWLATLVCVIGLLARDPEPGAFLMPAFVVCGLFVWHSLTPQ
ncbi:MAG: hypothetical protein ACM336_00480 [Acidobacteriota bacterium]